MKLSSHHPLTSPIQSVLGGTTFAGLDGGFGNGSGEASGCCDGFIPAVPSRFVVEGGTTPGETGLDDGFEAGSWKFVGFADVGDDVDDATGEGDLPNWLVIIMKEMKEISIEKARMYQLQRQKKRQMKN